jgi:xanthine dehydrogenase YagS FAD-binding subunit
MDRETWTHAVVSAAVVLEMDQQVCRSARVVLGGVAPIPWRLQAVEQMLTGKTITPDLAAQASEAAVTGARALSKNAYKIPMTKAVVRRTLLETVQQA